MPSGKRIKSARIELRVTPEKKARWRAYLGPNELNPFVERVVDAYILEMEDLAAREARERLGRELLLRETYPQG